jgi:hypothetical protein
MTLTPERITSDISEVTTQTTAMASVVTMRVTRRDATSDEQFDRALQSALNVFHDVERICTAQCGAESVARGAADSLSSCRRGIRGLRTH